MFGPTHSVGCGEVDKEGRGDVGAVMGLIWATGYGGVDRHG